MRLLVFQSLHTQSHPEIKAEKKLMAKSSVWNETNSGIEALVTRYTKSGLETFVFRLGRSGGSYITKLTCALIAAPCDATGETQSLY